MPYVGKTPVVGNFVKLDAIVTSATATYNLLNGSVAYFPQTANNCIVSLNGVIQSPTSAYTISGSTIVFDSALTSSDSIDFILVLGDVLAIGTPSDSTVSFAKVTSNLITGATAETTIDGADNILIYDDSATALRKMTRTNFVAGIGATAGQVIQVVSATDSTQRTTTSTSYVTGSNTLSVTITPSASANKVLIIYSGEYNTDGGAVNIVTLFRDATNLEASSNSGFRASNVTEAAGISIVHYDSPNTTSAVTYQIYFRGNSGTTVRLANNSRPASITAMEIKG